MCTASAPACPGLPFRVAMLAEGADEIGSHGVGLCTGSDEHARVRFTIGQDRVDPAMVQQHL